MKKIICITMLMLSLIYSQDTSKTNSPFKIKFSSISAGYYNKYIIGEYVLISSSDQYILIQNGDSYVLTQFIKIGFSLSDKTELEFYKMWSRMDVAINNYTLNHNSSFINRDDYKDHFGLSLQYKLSNQLYINLGFCILDEGRSKEQVYPNSYTFTDSDIEWNKHFQPFGGITYKLPIIKDYYIPIGIHTFLPAVVSNDYPASTQYVSFSVGIGKL